MFNDKYEIIEKLMELLSEELQEGPEDLESRLGRKKPDVEVVKLGMSEDKFPEEEVEEEMEVDPEEDLKSRLMNIRG